jgi:tetraacyldisaccharide 4'-kinase
LWSYLLPFRLKLRRRGRLNAPVISVGNLTLGGTGKTTAVRYLCKRLQSLGWRPSVLSYGYGGSLNGRFGIVSGKKGPVLKPEVAGDEPVMLASAMPGVPVIVCKNRTKSGKSAIKQFKSDLALLDDGFQAWKIKRDLDIVLVSSDNPFDNGKVLPAGRLRENPKALRRADCVIVTGVNKIERKERLLELIGKYTKAPVYFAWYKPTTMISLAGDFQIGVDDLKERKVFALSSIANPLSFEQTLSRTGADIVERERFPDHYMYSSEDTQRIIGRAISDAVEFIVTTDKDAVKLKNHQFAVPVFALGIDLDIEDEEGFWNFVESRIGTSPSFQAGNKMLEAELGIQPPESGVAGTAEEGGQDTLADEADMEEKAEEAAPAQ